jgi:hypothetical protein
LRLEEDIPMVGAAPPADMYVDSAAVGEAPVEVDALLQGG